ncbi:hypothetical protein [Kaistia terrae]|uniref:Uncharacterized protein n=1 Tax=Kaistia terrae TaxID=537017 RepID=A0ABW0Q8J6_9HYPH|nr:hypothetical protein [Kaistia terrae]MCX5581481.1 hypothetical protein [Kaistia terrae]
MTDEIELRRDVERAARAEALINDTLLSEAFTTLKATYLEAWEASHLRDTEGRERLFQAVKLVGSVQSHLVIILSDGQLAKHELATITGATGEISVD